MTFLLRILLAVTVGVVTGLGSAWLAVGEGWLFPTFRAGEWRAWPEGGSTAPDPYSRALLARTAQVPLGSGEGIAFFIARDSENAPIRGGCDYSMVGEAPQSRLWTLEAIDAQGRPSVHRSGRSFIHSREVLRRPDGRFEILLSPYARPGNWLPTPDSGSLTLVMRLYDSAAANPATAGTVSMPRVDWRGGCR